MGDHYLNKEEIRTIHSPSGAARYLQNQHPPSSCAICGVASAPRRRYEFSALARWVERDAPNLGNIARFGGSTAPDGADPSSRMRLPETRDRCVCCESQLQPTLAIPRHLVSAVLLRLNATQRLFLMESMIIWACKVCCTSDFALRETAHTIQGTYMRANQISSEKALKRTRGIEPLFQILAIVEEELRLNPSLANPA